MSGSRQKAIKNEALIAYEGFQYKAAMNFNTFFKRFKKSRKKGQV